MYFPRSTQASFIKNIELLSNKSDRQGWLFQSLTRYLHYISSNAVRNRITGKIYAMKVMSKKKISEKGKIH